MTSELFPATPVVAVDPATASAVPLGAAQMVLIRHGQTDWNKAGRLQGQVDIPLNETGKEQAQLAARSLEGQGFTRVVTSPLGRAFETGSIIAAHLGLPVPTTDPGLVERAYGELEGAVDADLPEQTRHVLHPGHGADPTPVEEEGYRLGLLPGVERSRATGERGLEALRRVHGMYPEDRIIVVAHGTLIRLALDSLDQWQRFHPSPANAEATGLDDAQWAFLTGGEATGR